jgi:hypothetical protein
VGPGLVESAAAELTDQEGQIARHVVGDLARPPGVPESEMFALVDQAEKGGLVGGAPDPQAAGAAARMTAKIAVNGRTGAPGIPVGWRGRIAGSGPPRFGSGPATQRFTVGSG